MVKTRSHMVQMMVYIRKTDHKHCFGTNHHFPWAPELRIDPNGCPGQFLSKETIKNRSHMIKNRVYIRFYRKISKRRIFFVWMIPICFSGGFELPGPGSGLFLWIFFRKNVFFHRGNLPDRPGPGKKTSKKHSPELPAWPARNTEFPCYGSY